MSKTRGGLMTSKSRGSWPPRSVFCQNSPPCRFSLPAEILNVAALPRRATAGSLHSPRAHEFCHDVETEDNACATDVVTESAHRTTRSPYERCWLDLFFSKFHSAISTSQRLPLHSFSDSFPTTNLEQFPACTLLGGKTIHFGARLKSTSLILTLMLTSLFQNLPREGKYMYKMSFSADLAALR